MKINELRNLLKQINVLCYSEEQGCPHLENLDKHIENNINYPNNTYFIVKMVDAIPKEILEDKTFNELSQYIRFKSPNFVDFSNLQIDFPEINQTKRVFC